jgi:L-gulono-1,4-lactone dehydrogenase
MNGSAGLRRLTPILAAGSALAVALADGPAWADPPGCRAVPTQGIVPPPAALTWRPFLGKKRLLVPAGLLAPPVSTLPEALAAIDEARSEPGRRSAFLVRPYLQGFIVYDYPLAEAAGFSIGSVVVTGFPFGGSAEKPEALLVDGDGKAALLRRESGRFRLVPVETGALLAGGSPASDDGLPWVVPGRLKNVAETKWTPQWAFRPGLDEAGVARLVAWLNRQPPSLKVKAGGSRHSWSSVAVSDGAFIHPEGMRCLEPAADDGTLRADLPEDFRGNLVRIGAGTVIREINDTLWETHGKSLGALGGYDGQTLGGVLPTGTHGSVLSHGPLAEMIRSVDLVAGSGDPLRIEPKDGPTDPAAFSREHPASRLIRDDAVFDAVLIHVGTMGVVRSMVVEVRDRFWLREVRTSVPLDVVRTSLLGGGIYRQFEGVAVPGWVADWSGRPFVGHPFPAYHLELLINPRGDDVIVTTRQPTPLPGPEPPFLRERPERNLFRLQGTPRPYRREIGVVWFSENFPEGIGWVSETLMETLPPLTPNLVDGAMNGLKNPGYLQRSYRVFNIGDGQNAIPNRTGSIEVPLRDDLYLKALDTIRRVAWEQAPHGLYQTGPISMRFVRASRAMLGNPEDVCSFELIFVRHTTWAGELIQAYDTALRRDLGEANVRFHWGQLMPGATKARLLANYPRYEEWRRIRDRLDPAGRFVNTYQESILP